jgi:hypothetical protein
MIDDESSRCAAVHPQPHGGWRLGPVCKILMIVCGALMIGVFTLGHGGMTSHGLVRDIGGQQPAAPPPSVAGALSPLREGVSTAKSQRDDSIPGPKAATIVDQARQSDSPRDLPSRAQHPGTPLAAFKVGHRHHLRFLHARDDLVRHTQIPSAPTPDQTPPPPGSQHFVGTQADEERPAVESQPLGRSADITQGSSPSSPTTDCRLTPGPRARDLGVCVRVKDDAAALDEFLAFHWVQGAGHFVVLDVGSSSSSSSSSPPSSSSSGNADDTLAMLAKYSARGVLDYVDLRAKSSPTEGEGEMIRGRKPLAEGGEEMTTRKRKTPAEGEGEEEVIRRHCLQRLRQHEALRWALLPGSVQDFVVPAEGRYTVSEVRGLYDDKDSSPPFITPSVRRVDPRCPFPPPPLLQVLSGNYSQTPCLEVDQRYLGPRPPSAGREDSVPRGLGLLTENDIMVLPTPVGAGRGRILSVTRPPGDDATCRVLPPAGADLRIHHYVRSGAASDQVGLVAVVLSSEFRFSEWCCNS